MKKILVFSALLGFLLAPVAWAEDSSQSRMVSNDVTHELQTYMHQLNELQMDLKTIQSRVSNLEMKPYLDPKGFKRQALKRLMEKKHSEYASLEQRVTELKTRSENKRKS
ncbi:MAG: hypothetical protein D6690_14275 [Nitrospirae bacterium]|nr:MAG: hypothetical protein D6690_14275 [Nitrospirota bacterium]